MAMANKFIPYTHQSIDKSDIQAVSDSLKQDFITRGPNVEAFEQAVAKYCGVKHAIAFNSGTTALMGAYSAAGMGEADRLITTPNTFVATVGAGVQLGTTPVFVDIDPSTGNLDLSQVEVNLDYRSSRGKTFIAPVHFAGIPVDMKKLFHMTFRKDVCIIEDAAHALGSLYPSGEKVGSCTYSDMAVFSFHPAKHITTGEGGMVVTKDEDLAQRVRRYRNNGIERGEIPWYYEVQELTGNFHFNEMQGALGLSQLKRLKTFIDKRRSLVKYYRSLLQNIRHITLMTDRYDDITAFHLFVVYIDFAALKTDRTAFMHKLKEAGIGTQLHYIPVYAHPFFKKKYGEIAEYFPKMEKYYAQALSLPLFYDLSMENVEYVCKTLKLAIG